MTMRIAAKLHFNRGLDFIYLSDNRLPMGYAEHVHDYVEIVVALEGKAAHRINAIPYDISPGDVFVIQGNTRHGFESASPDFRVANIMYMPSKVLFPFQTLQKMPGYQALFVMEPAKRLEGEFKSRLSLDGLALSETLSLFRRMEDELQAKRPGFECLLQALLLETVTRLSREYSRATEGAATQLLRMGEAVAWMEANYASRISLPELAKMAALSERQFLRLFRKTFGHAPVEHLLRIRVKAAERMLGDGCNVSEAAFACGFNDSCYFSRQFKRFMGISPKRHALSDR